MALCQILLPLGSGIGPAPAVALTTNGKPLLSAVEVPYGTFCNTSASHKGLGLHRSSLISESNISFMRI